MLRKEIIFFFAIILIGFLDWLTTVTGVIFFGATEINPILSGLTGSSMIIFSVVKLSAVALAGVAFYKAAELSKPQTSDWHFTRKFVNGGVSLMFLALTIVVASNILTIFKL